MQNRIKRIRAEMGLTQSAFGEKIGLSQNFIWMLETGQRVPSDRTIRDICREFGVSETWLRTGAGEMKADTTREEEMGALLGSLLADRPESFRSALITALLRFDPDGPEWEVLERIYRNIAAEAEAETQKDREP